MVTLEFGVADLANTRFSISPMDHLVRGAVQADVHRCVSVRRDRWWRQVRSLVPNRAAPFLDLVNASALGLPDFLAADSSVPCRQLADELDAILAVSETALQRDLSYYDREPDLPLSIQQLRDGGSRQLRRIADGAWVLFQTCLAPDWPDLRRLLLADITHRSRTMARCGIGTMLAGLHPHVSWRQEGALRFPVAGWHHTVDLAGRGLELRPNFFLEEGISALLVEHRQPVVFHPISTRTAQGAPLSEPDGLRGLIGPARTRALRVIGRHPCTTTELAQRLGITPPSASAHAAALRTAGAITTEREGRQVRHTLTPLGHDLLLSNPEQQADSRGTSRSPD